MSQFDDGFEAPTEAPQLDQAYQEIHSLMFDTPQWSSAMSAELVYLCRTHVTVRAAIMYALELARPKELSLRHLDSVDEIRRAQGAVAALESYVNSLLQQMADVESSSGDDEDV